MSGSTPDTQKMISRPATDARVIQWLCFLAAPAMLGIGFWKTARVASTEAEAFGLTLGCLSLTFVIVILGLITPLAWKKPSV